MLSAAIASISLYACHPRPVYAYRRAVAGGGRSTEGGRRPRHGAEPLEVLAAAQGLELRTVQVPGVGQQPTVGGPTEPTDRAVRVGPLQLGPPRGGERPVSRPPLGPS